MIESVPTRSGSIVHVNHFSIHQQLIGQFIVQNFDGVARPHARSRFPILQLVFVKFTTRSQPMLMIRLVATSWIRDNQF